MPPDFRSRIILAAKSTTAAAFDKSAKSAGALTGRLKTIAKAGAVAGAALGVAFGVQAIRKQIAFSAAISELSAITGAVGADLEFLTNKAKEFGRTTTLSASQAAEAFKLVASAKPDLLENRDALVAVTEQAILLAEAAGITLPEAAKTVGEALNQFGEGADQANRFVNVLAAGAKFGSSEIAQTSEALINAGVAAKSAGLSFEETNAAIQVLASAGIKGSDAGTKLRSALIKLQVQAEDKFNPSIVGVNKALENLAEANLDITDRVALFGERSLVVGDILIQNTAQFNKLEMAVTGTDTALEQAAARNDNLAGDIKKLQSAFEGLSLAIAEKFEPTLRAVTQIFTELLNEMTEVQEGSKELSVSFEFLDATFRAVLGTIQTIDTVFEGLGTRIGGTFAAISLVLEGEFSAALDTVRATGEDVADILETGFLQAAATFTGETAQAVIEKLTDSEILDAAKVGGIAIAEAVVEGTRSAGERAAEEAAMKELESLQTKIESIRQANLDEGLLLQEKLAVDLQLITSAREMDLLNLNEFLELKFGLISNAEEKLKRLSMKNDTDSEKFARLTAKGKTKFVLGQLAAITQGAATENKALFRINQAAAIGSAIINTAEGITQALKLPFPLNFAIAAITAAAGAVQIGTIASAKPGGGTTPTFSASTPTVGGTPVQGITPPTLDELGGGGGTGREINIQIQGLPESGVMPAEAVRELMRSINEELGDGVNLNVSGGQGGGT